MVNITMIHSYLDKPSGRSTKPTLKKTRVQKLASIRVTALTRVDFVKELLRAHELQDEYSAGVHVGPGFKMWWTGSR